ncbi:AAA family ATPase [Salipiger sp. H15]|uniref:AAA family ATPase n=1 Tax=Alloyangia sp. H15 TaxID=3029062 RepID=A0AAU8AEJ1_9RHOB
MARIQIVDFSCISHADMDITDINVIIGPQGSGKSVTTKLFNFFTEILSDFQRSAEDGLTVSDYKKQLHKRFVMWFPPAAWGSKRFNISYTSGDFSIRILRRTIKKQLSDEVSITTSKWFDSIYDFALKSHREIAASRVELQASDEYSAANALEMSWQVRSKVNAKISREIKEVYYLQQTFIPAGRAFFTSIGRLVAGIEHAGSLDPVTLKFARVFANWRDRSESHFLHGLADEAFATRRNEMMMSLFGGRVSTKRESEYIEMQDGRKVPFSSLSSGQQELMPIWYFLENIMLNDALENRRKRIGASAKNKQLIYIEEPEAHLFPSAQSALMDALIGTILGEKSRRSLILTTHSPYIMTKLNVFLKAGQISRRKKKNSDLNDIIGRSCWIRRDQLSAWCIRDGEVVSIIDEEEGLIDAQYLDSISDTLSDEFNALLDLEETI